MQEKNKMKYGKGKRGSRSVNQGRAVSGVKRKKRGKRNEEISIIPAEGARIVNKQRL